MIDYYKVVSSFESFDSGFFVAERDDIEITNATRSGVWLVKDM